MFPLETTMPLRPLIPVPEPPSDDPLYYWRFAVQALGAIGTLAAVLIALWDRLRNVVFRPALSIGFLDPKNPIQDKLLSGPQMSEGPVAVQFVVDVAVSNARGTIATQCGLAIERVRRVTASGSHDIDRQFAASGLPWIGVTSEFTSIYKGFPAEARLATLRRDEERSSRSAGVLDDDDADPVGARPRSKQARAILEIPLLLDKQTGEIFSLPAGKYIIATVLNMQGRAEHRTEWEIQFDGTWYEHLAQVKQNFHVKMCGAGVKTAS